ncbi:unnamed protein product (macronuclear) [Paramecium tetraurelia]|uniref:Uncharacterized protein n=1 Tax=Paramecium tetraurelia TaxID=5888 RepID=A0CT07_PARTE|nr:uncharacterized protein GSPATT00038942001 [Paramecium tetraurelia]CAK73924.1 unnamed protein product [Paramecium tetraurelia]|eukprot:XP_001441321.1 hypothetical protein (macronuclear) [Paramecium tetraurelia strain d4-2]
MSNLHFLLIYFQQYNNDQKIHLLEQVQVKVDINIENLGKSLSRGKRDSKIQNNDKTDKTQNQSLVEMGGFVFDTNFVVLTAKKTNLVDLKDQFIFTSPNIECRNIIL